MYADTPDPQRNAEEGQAGRRADTFGLHRLGQDRQANYSFFQSSTNPTSRMCVYKEKHIYYFEQRKRLV